MVFFAFTIGVLIFSPFFMLLLFKPFCELRDITLSPTLEGLKRRDKVEMFVGFFLLTGYLAVLFAHYFLVSPGMTTCSPVGCFINIFVCLSISAFYPIPFTFVAQLLLSTWLMNIDHMFCKSHQYENKLKWSKKCLKMYEKLQNCLGPYFLFSMTFTQLIWILLFFMGTVLTIGKSDMGTSNLVIHSLGKCKDIFKVKDSQI